MALCTRQISASEIARRIGVSRAVLYKWKDEIIGNSAYQTMRKHNEPSLEAERDALREEVARLNQEIRRRQMELDILTGRDEMDICRLLKTNEEEKIRQSELNIIRGFYAGTAEISGL